MGFFSDIRAGLDSVWDDSFLGKVTEGIGNLDSSDFDYAVDKVGDIFAIPVAVIEDAMTGGTGGPSAGIIKSGEEVVEETTEAVGTAINLVFNTAGDAAKNAAGELEGIAWESLKPALLIGGIVLFAAVVIGTSRAKVLR